MAERIYIPIGAVNRRTDPIAQWLIEDAYRIPTTLELVSALAERMNAWGIPVLRLNYLMSTLHPELFGSRYLWVRGKGADAVDAPRAVVTSPEFVRSPVAAVTRERRAIRRRLVGPKALFDFPLLAEIRAEGATDFVCVPVEFSTGHVNVVSVTTDAPRGFSRGDLDRMFALLPLFARVVEVQALRRLATGLLDIYVGQDAGRRILSGQIVRGDGETIPAAVWSCDLRGFTALAVRLSGNQLIALLNDYFARMVAPVHAHGGEVLKFIGDFVLAIFRATAERDEASVCAAGLAAASAAAAGMAELNRARRAAHEPVLRLGIGLHFGDVIYGNIGASGRLDFTAIGPAVNLVTRLEHLTRTLGRPIAVSKAVADRLPGRLEALGLYRLRGVRTQQHIFTLPVLDALPAATVAE
ncbi:MAG: adenylate/guanylate cyclase domain-containing protein [Alphaproteobacteria bacterium]|nr:adenylate/guanylate cyclase domain-containing protein [Alphaproteobacteria bacterium]